MATPIHLCVVGSANMDLTFRTSRLPRPGETLTVQGFHQGFGGKGANQAVAAARLGACVRFVARVGDDAFGQESLRHYQAEGLDTTDVRADARHPTGTAAIIVDDQANNCILVVPGANAALSPEDVREAAPAITSSRLLLCQLEVPLDATGEALRLAQAAGVRTILNPAPATELPDELLQLTNLCIPNETEAELLTGQPAGSREEAEAAAGQLLRRGAQAVIVTRGEHGAVLVDEEGVTHIPTARVEAVDPTAAGDAFTGSLAVFWAEGLPLREAARRACLVAALTVTRPGAQAALPSRVEAAAFLAAHGIP